MGRGPPGGALLAFEIPLWEHVIHAQGDWVIGLNEVSVAVVGAARVAVSPQARPPAAALGDVSTLPRVQALRLATLVLLSLTLAACNCGGTINVGGDTDGGLLPDGGTATGGGTSGTGGGSGGTGGGAGSTGGGNGGPMTEVCDGLDNDFNGIIDDVDTAGDGVCDCLKIATLGYAGQWGSGSVFTMWLNGKSQQGVAALESQTLTDALLRQYDVIVVQDVRSGAMSGVGNGLGRSYSQAEVDALKGWVAAGGGVMTLIGYSDSSEVVNVNALLTPYGLSYGTQPVLGAINGSTRPITNWATHPLAEHVTRVGTDNGYAVNGGGTVVAWDTRDGHVDVARATDYQSGRVFVWGDEWITYDSEWSAHADYQVERFWLNALKWLSPIDRCQVDIPDIN